jgi:hypothetical protein
VFTADFRAGGTLGRRPKGVQDNRRFVAPAEINAHTFDDQVCPE